MVATEPEALVDAPTAEFGTAASGEPEPVNRGDGSELPLWNAVERLLEAALSAQEPLKTCAAQSHRIKDELGAAADVLNPHAAERLFGELKANMTRRAELEADARHVLGQARKHVAALALTSEGGALGRAAFDRLLALVDAIAAPQSDGDLGDQVRCAIGAARTTLRDARREALAGVVARLRARIAEGETLHVPATAARELLDSEAFLDFPLVEAERRLSDETFSLEKQIEVERAAQCLQTAQRAAVDLDALLAGDGNCDLAAVRSLLAAAMLAPDVAAADTHRERVRRAVRLAVKTPSAAGSAPGREWLEIVKLAARDGDPLDRVRLALHGLSETHPGDDAEHVATDIIFECEALDEADQWRLVETALDCAPAWAPAFFRVVCGSHADAMAIARWLLLSQTIEQTRPALVAQAVSGADPRVAWAVQRWADDRLGTSASADDYLDAWLATTNAVPLAECLRRRMVTLQEDRAAGARMLLATAIAAARSDSESPDDALSELDRRAFPNCYELLVAASANDKTAMSRLTNGDVRRKQARLTLDTIARPRPLDELARARRAFYDDFQQALDSAPKFITDHCREAWLAFARAQQSRFRALYPDGHGGATPLDGHTLRASLSKLVDDHRKMADVHHAKKDDRVRMDDMVARLQSSGLAVLDAYDRAALYQLARPSTREAWEGVVVPALHRAREVAQSQANPEEALACVEVALQNPRVSAQLDADPAVRPIVKTLVHDMKIALQELCNVGTGAQLFSAELSRLAETGLEGQVAAAHLRALADAGMSGRLPQPQPLPNSPDEKIGAVFGTEVPLEFWRYHLAEPKDREVALGLDALEQIARLGGLDVAVANYLQRGEFDLARRATEQLSDDVREDGRRRVQEAMRSARSDALAKLEALVNAPLTAAQAEWPGTEANERDAIESILRDANTLAVDSEHEEPGRLRRSCDALVNRAQRLVADHERRQAEALDRLDRELLQGPRRQPFTTDDSRTRARMVRAYAFLLEGNVGAALRTLDGEIVPDLKATDTTPIVVPVARTLPSRQPVPPAAMVATDVCPHLRNILLHGSDDIVAGAGAKPDHHDVRRTTHDAYSRNDPLWRGLLGQTALDLAYGSALTGNMKAAEEFARDAAGLLAHASPSPHEHAIREALVLWLAVVPERNPAAFPPDAPTNWQSLRGDASGALVQALVRNFFIRGVPHDLGEVLIAAVRMGGPAADELLGAFDRLGEGSKARLVHEVIASVPTSNAVRAVAAGRALEQLLSSTAADPIARGLMSPAEVWDRSASVQAFRTALLGSGLSDANTTTVLDALRARSRHGASVVPELKIHARIVGKSLYLSRPDTLGVIAEFSNTSDATFAAMRNATARVTLQEASGLRFRAGTTSANRIERRLDVLHSGGALDVWLPLQITGRAPTNAKLKVELFDGFNRPISFKGDHRTVSVVVRQEYPAHLADESPPYPQGHDLPLESIEGRDDVLERIFRRLTTRGTDSPVFVVGPRRVGKSTVLRKIQYTGKFADRYELAYVDFEDGTLSPNEDSTCTFLAQLAARIQAALKHAGAREVPPPRISPSDPARSFATYLERVSERLGDRRLLLLLDEFQMLFSAIAKGEERQQRGYDKVVSEDVIGWFRSWMQHLPVSFILAGQEREMKRAAGTRDSRLFALGDWVSIGALGEKAARAMIERPKKYPDASQEKLFDAISEVAVARALVLTGRHPFLLSLLGAELVERAQRLHRSHIGVADVEEAAGALVANPAGQVAHALSSLQDRAAYAVLWVLARATAQGETPTRSELFTQLEVSGLASYQRELDNVLVEYVAREETEVALFEAISSQDGEERYRTNPLLLAKAIAKKPLRSFLAGREIGE